MLPVSASELASIQADAQAAACDQSCVIGRPSKSSDGMLSESIPSYTTQETTVCGVSEPTGTQLANYDFRIGSLKAWQVKLPVGTNVQEQDHIILSNQTLVVQALLQPRSYQALLTVLASEVS